MEEVGIIFHGLVLLADFCCTALAVALAECRLPTANSRFSRWFFLVQGHSGGSSGVKRVGTTAVGKFHNSIFLLVCFRQCCCRCWRLVSSSEAWKHSSLFLPCGRVHSL